MVLDLLLHLLYLLVLQLGAGAVVERPIGPLVVARSAGAVADDRKSEHREGMLDPGTQGLDREVVLTAKLLLGNSPAILDAHPSYFWVQLRRHVQQMASAGNEFLQCTFCCCKIRLF